MNSGSTAKNSGSGKVQWQESEYLTLLRTKHHIPQLGSTCISRSRLIKRMDEGFGRKLTLLSAPAGFGKTTLLADWIHNRSIPSAWVSVDSGDNDPMHFLAYLILGLQTLKRNTGKAALTMLQSPQPPPIESILINLINDLVRIPTDAALVLDDYHAVDAKPIHDMIFFLLERLPRQMHMIIATRSDPPFPITRIRSQNQLTELRAADLSFTTDETTKLFNNRMNLNLSSVDIQILETRTEGWIAGLQLAALSMSGRNDPSVFLNAFKGDHRYIADYLTEEVLNRQPGPLRDFMLKTSILDRLNASLCEAVTQANNCQNMLNALDKANLFVIPLDEERCWYRYHHLFADLLKLRLRRKLGDRVGDLHRRASQWLTRNGFNNEAMVHAFVAQDCSLAARLIKQIAEADWDRARESRLLRWFEKLPDDLINADPKLCIFYARELFNSGHPDDAERKLQAAEHLLDDGSGHDQAQEGLKGRIAVIRAYVAARTGDVPRVVHFSNQALKLLPRGDFLWRSVAATTLGFGHGWTGEGDCVKAQRAFSRAMKNSQAAGNLYYYVFSGSCLGGVLLMRGKLKQATDVYRRLLDHAIDNGIEQMGILGSLYSNLGMILCEWNDLDEGLRLIEKGIELSESGRDPVILASCQIILMKAFLYRMDFANAADTMEKINECAGRFMLPPWITNTVSALNVYIWLATGDLGSALNWADERKLSVDDEVQSLRELEYLAYAHILFFQQRLDDADGLLRRLIENAEIGDRVYLVVEMRLWRVLILCAKGEKTIALKELNIALSLAEPGGFLMAFLSKGKPVAELLEEILRVKQKDGDDTNAGCSRSYVKKIAMAFKAVMPPKIEGLMDPMSDRELDVLHLIAAGLSNREIAEKLFISLNTVKSHTKNINSKLSVNSRTKAVAQAKALGLL